MAAPAAVLSILVRANTGAATTGLLRVNQQLGSTEKRANKLSGAFNVMGKAAAVGAVGIAAGLAYSVKKAADFEQQISSLGAVSEASGRQMERFRKQAMKAGADTKFSALEAAEAQTELAKGGLAVRQIMRGGLKSALALASAGEMELADAAEATVNAMKLFGLRGKDAMKVADGFATAANRTTADVADFAMALKMGGSAAKAAGLSFGETTAALEALAEMGIRNSDAGTSLKSMLVQIAAPTIKAEGAMADLGLKFFDTEGKMKSLTKISAMLRDKLGDLTNEDRLKAVKEIAGTDGMRALLALFDAGPKKMAKFQQELGQTGTAADVAKKKQDNLKGAMEQLSGSVETLGITIGTAALPMIRELADDVTGLVNKIGKIAQRDDLDLGEKISKSFEVAKVDAQPWIDKITAAVKQADLPQRLADAISAATPVIVGAVVSAAKVAVPAFIKAWWDSDAWGKFAISAFLLSKMGGIGAFTALGNKGGAAMGSGMRTALSRAGIAGVIAAAIAISLKQMSDKYKEQTAKLETSEASFYDSILRLGRQGRTAEAERFEALRDELLQTSGSADDLRKGMEKLADTAGRTSRSMSREFGEVSTNLRARWQEVRASTSTTMQDIRQQVRSSTIMIKTRLGDDTAEGKEALAKNFRQARNVVRETMRDSTGVTAKGLREIRRLMVEELKAYGISPGAALSIVKHGDIKGKAGTGPGPAGRQRGGPIDMGAPSGDSVPAMLEKGEYVVNRRAVSKVGRKALDALNFGAAPRFQGGGIVALGHQLQQQGYEVGEHPAFGGVHPVHAPNSYHYRGMAIDVNDDAPPFAPGGPEPGSLDRLYKRLKGTSGIVELLWRVAGHFNHLHVAMSGAGGPLGGATAQLDRVKVGGAGSALKSVVQGALDMTGGGAQAQLDAVAASMGAVEGSSEGGMFSGKWAQVMAGIAKARGWSLAAWKRLVQKESGGNPNAVNPSSGAFGLGQFLGATARQYSKFGALSHDPVAQIRAMAQYISDRYGDPSAALAFHDRNNYYAAGGMVGTATKGREGIPGAGSTAMPLGKQLKKTLRKVRGGDKGAVKDMLDKIKDIGLPKDLAASLKTHAANADIFGDFADRADQLTVTDDDGNITSLGLVGGKNQIQWLTDQLGALFKWRNAIIQAEKIAVAKREQTAAMIEKAREQLAKVRAQIQAADAERDALAAKLKQAEKKPNANKTLVKDIKARIKDIDFGQRGRERTRDALKDKIIPALTGKRSALVEARGSLLSNLDDVQGLGSPTNLMSALPALGVLGGRIFDVQMRLGDLTAAKPKITDTAATEEKPGVAEALEFARQETARANLSEVTFKALSAALRDLPVYREGYGGMPRFATGGVVAGPIGAAVPAIVHGGEGVFTREQMAAMGSPNVTIYIDPAMAWLKNFIRVEANDIGQTVGLSFSTPGTPGITARH
jgi:TP901 family phage tail tape measure protein